MCKSCSKLATKKRFDACFDVSIVDFEQVNAGWVVDQVVKKISFRELCLKRLNV